MMRKNIEVTIRGKQKTWGFVFKADPKHLDEWRADGLEVDEVLNIIPQWAQRIGLTRIWCAVQDAWQWLRVW